MPWLIMADPVKSSVGNIKIYHTECKGVDYLQTTYRLIWVVSSLLYKIVHIDKCQCLKKPRSLLWQCIVQCNMHLRLYFSLEALAD